MGDRRLPDARGAVRAAACTLLTLLVAAQAARAETLALVLDPAASTITFQLGATLHTVDGTVALRSGELEFSDEGGPASGRIVVDAKSASTGLASRDSEMHETVLQSAAHPEIAFEVNRVEILRRDEKGADVVLHGVFELLAGSHPSEIPARVERVGPAEGSDRIRATAEVELPYVSWGLEDVSNFVLRVDDFVSVAIEVEGTLGPVARER